MNTDATEEPGPASSAPAWSSADLRFFDDVRELEITAPRTDGTFGAWTPIWVVVVKTDVFVRTWHRRETGWYGRAVRTRRARLRVSGETVDVMVDPTGESDAVDEAYRAKYGAGGAQSMVTTEAAASTLRLRAVQRRHSS